MGTGWAEFFSFFSMYSVIIPFVICLAEYTDLTDLQQSIGLLVLLTCLGEISIYLLTVLGINNLPAVHIFTVLQFIVLVWIMKKGLSSYFPKNVFQGLIIGFVLFALIDAFFLNGWYNFNSYSRPLASFILPFLALCFFYKTMKELKISSLEREPLLWLSIGIIIYFPSSLLVFLFTNHVKTSNEVLLTLWGIHAIFNIILNATYSIALWIKPPK